MIKNNHFIYLNTYNIETYFIDEKASLIFAKGLLKLKNSELLEKFCFYKWREKIISQSKKLFLCYCFIKKNHPSIENVNRNPYLFLDSRTGFEKEGAFDKYWNRVLSLNSNALDEINNIDNMYKSINGDNYFNLICGKFLLLSLCLYMRDVTGEKFRHEDFRWTLICNFDISTLNYVKEQILSNYK